MPEYPYDTRLNIQFGPLEVIDVQAVADTCTHPWFNQTLCQVMEDRSVELRPRQAFVVPKGVRHRPRAPERTIVLMVEGAGIVPTGD